MRVDIGKHNSNKVEHDFDLAINKHCTIMGASGSGKSVFGQRLITEIVKGGGTVVVFDIHGVLSEEQIFECYRQEFSTYRRDIYAYKEGIPLQVFQPLVFADGSLEDIKSCCIGVAEVIARVISLGAKQKLILTDAIVSAIGSGEYERDGLAAIGHQLSISDKAEVQYVYNKLHSLFIGKGVIQGDNLIERNKINIIHMNNYDVALQEVLAELVLSYLWRLANADKFKGDNEIFLFLDEVQNYQSTKDSSVSRFLAEGRKMGVHLILATQLLTNENRNRTQMSMQQAGLRLFFKPAANNIYSTARVIDVTREKKWAEVLQNLKRGEYVAIGTLVIGNKLIEYPLTIDGKKVKED